MESSREEMIAGPSSPRLPELRIPTSPTRSSTGYDDTAAALSQLRPSFGMDDGTPVSFSTTDRDRDMEIHPDFRSISPSEPKIGLGRGDGDLEMDIDEPDIDDGPHREIGEVGEESVWKCEWSKCGKCLEDQSSLVKHLQSEHIPPHRDVYTCKWNDCRRRGDRQATRHSLITHVRAHTGERPYTCPQPHCGKTFTRSDAMNKHLRSIHNVPTEQANLRLKDKLAREGRDSPYTSQIDPSLSTSGQAPPPPPPSFHSDYPSPQYDLSPSYERPLPLPSPRPIVQPMAIPKPPRNNRPSILKTLGFRGSTNSKKSNNTIITATSPTDSMRRHRPSPPPVAIGPDGMTYIRYGSDADLMTDLDIAAVLPRIRNRPIVYINQEETRAIATIRSKFPRTDNNGAEELDDDIELEDSFDEGVAKVNIDESKVEIGRIGESGMIGERSVYGRSKWGVRYIMAKSKLMLAEEEMRMRQGELNSLVEEEEALKRTLDEMGRAGWQQGHR